MSHKVSADILENTIYTSRIPQTLNENDIENLQGDSSAIVTLVKLEVRYV